MTPYSLGELARVPHPSRSTMERKSVFAGCRAKASLLEDGAVPAPCRGLCGWATFALAAAVSVRVGGNVHCFDWDWPRTLSGVCCPTLFLFNGANWQGGGGGGGRGVRPLDHIPRPCAHGGWFGASDDVRQLFRCGVGNPFSSSFCRREHFQA
jgi:hypothetical protein